MNYETWSPVYEQILADFGFDRGADEQARDELASLLAESLSFDPDHLDVAGDTVAIAGAGPSLTDADGPEMDDSGTADSELDRAREADAVFAASTAAAVLRSEGVTVDCMVTDLDKTPETARELTEEGTPVAAHAHGDNVSELRRWVPELDVTNARETARHLERIGAAPVEATGETASTEAANEVTGGTTDEAVEEATARVFEFSGLSDGERETLAATAVDARVLLEPGDSGVLLAGSPAALARLRSYVRERSGRSGEAHERLTRALSVVNEPKR